MTDHTQCSVIPFHIDATSKYFLPLSPITIGFSSTRWSSQSRLHIQIRQRQLARKCPRSWCGCERLLDDSKTPFELLVGRREWRCKTKHTSCSVLSAGNRYVYDGPLAATYRKTTSSTAATRVPSLSSFDQSGLPVRCHLPSSLDLPQFQRLPSGLVRGCHQCSHIAMLVFAIVAGTYVQAREICLRDCLARLSPRLCRPQRQVVDRLYVSSKVRLFIKKSATLLTV